MLWISHAHQNSTIKQPFKIQHLEGKQVWECGKYGIKNNGEKSQCDILTYFNRHLNHNNKMYPSAYNTYTSHVLYGIVTASLSLDFLYYWWKSLTSQIFLIVYCHYIKLYSVKSMITKFDIWHNGLLSALTQRYLYTVKHKLYEQTNLIHLPNHKGMLTWNNPS
jgi:hypothetical protein